MTFQEALAQMVAILSAANLERTGVTYEVRLGDEYLDANSSPPRIVIVPMSSQAVPARHQTGQSPRALAGEDHLFVAELWARANANDGATAGADYVAVSTMKATFVAAMRATFGPMFQLGSGQWTATEGDSTDEAGRSFNQQFTLSTILPDPGFVRQTVLLATTNIGITNPGQDFDAP